MDLNWLFTKDKSRKKWDLWLKNKDNVDSKKNKKVDNIKKTKVSDLFAIESKNAKKKKVRTITHLDLSHYWAKNDDSRIVHIINDLIVDALIKGVSDIHIEPREKEIIIRFRIDWEFVLYKKFDIWLKEALLARIKIISYLRIDENRLPQDWKINFVMFWWKSLDMRVSVIPTIYWEKCVIRLLKKDDTPPELKSLWILPYNMVKLKTALEHNHWMILAVWPTWSGKSTTLFSLLSQYDPAKKNISTLEDPVEYRINWVNHTQINPAINFNFADWLRSLLRQDPDIIMVWEIRDEQTAKLAIEASITGHMVYSTLHTNSAVHTIQRLVNLWVDPLLISSSLRLIISQRLARKLCTCCKEAYIADITTSKTLVKTVWRFMKQKENIKLYRPKEWGCNKCHWTGYKWRIWLYEVLQMTEKLEELLLKNPSKTQLEIQAVWDGMVPIRDDAYLKVILWETSLEEVISVLGWA